MTVQAKVQATVSAQRFAKSGLASALEDYTVEFAATVGDCSEFWGEERVIGSAGFDEVDFATIGIDVVKLLYVRNLSSQHQIALSAGWTGSQFSVFRQDTTAWNFSPMINLGSLTLRGYPIREEGTLLLSCPNSDGFGTTAGGSILRIGGTAGQSYEIYVMGT
jgi:hypothetical protein